MYLAKNQGKGNYVIFEPKMHQALMERIELEEDLRRGIDNREFVLHYQPIVTSNPADDGHGGVVRWKHPRCGLLPPDRFIPVAEETKLIVPLGEWYREACQQTQAWRQKYGGDLGISITVNIFIRQFQQKELVDIVANALADSGLPPGTSF